MEKPDSKTETSIATSFFSCQPLTVMQISVMRRALQARLWPPSLRRLSRLQARAISWAWGPHVLAEVFLSELELVVLAQKKVPSR